MLEASRVGEAEISDVLIVGGGPAGLTAGIALRQAGVANVRIAERQPVNMVLGSELMLQSAALRALDKIGVADACVAAGAPLAYSRYLTQTGEVLTDRQQPVRVTRDDLPHAIGIARPALHAALQTAAVIAGCRLEHDKSLAALLAREARPVAVFQDGESAAYDLVVGADGVNSTVRSLAFPAAPQPEYVGQVAWRARVPPLHPPRMEIYVAEQSKVGIITVSDTDAYLYHLHPEPNFRWIERADRPAILREKLQAFGGAVAHLRDRIIDPSEVHYTALSPLLVPPPWHAGRVLIIGDAAHATTPHMAYGAGLAIEDGVILGEEVAKGLAIDDMLQGFTARRWERCRMVVENGVQVAKWEIAPDTPDADPRGLTRQTQVALAGAA